VLATALFEKLTPANKSKTRKRMWSKFHAVRCGELSSLWAELFSNLGVSEKYTTDPILQQYENDRVFEGVIRSKTSPSLNLAMENNELTSDEMNTLRFVAGYVPFKLKKKITESSTTYSLYLE
jgi:hypothetical protein